MDSVLTEDPTEYVRLARHGRLFMVRFWPLTGWKGSLIIGIRVPWDEVSELFCRHRLSSPTLGAIERSIAIHSVRLMLAEQGIPLEAILGGRFEAEPTTLAAMIEEQDRCTKHLLSKEGRLFLDLVRPA